MAAIAMGTLLIDMISNERLQNALTCIITLMSCNYASSDVDLTVGYTIPELSEVRNAVSFEGYFIKGGYKTKNGVGVIVEYNDLSIPLDSYDWFVGISKEFKFHDNNTNDFKILINDERYKIVLESDYEIWKKVGIHSGFDHSQKYKGHGKLTDITTGITYKIGNKIKIGVDYSVGNAAGNKGVYIQDRVDTYVNFSDWL